VDQELFRGGVNAVLRTGNVVRRPAGPWTPAVHALLDHLARAGFGAAPKAHGLDDEGREILDFLPGEVPGYPMPSYVWADETLTAVAKLLRAFHDAIAEFVPPEDATWYLPTREPQQVICHGDVAPYNCVFRDGVPVALIDFDTAHPGPRVWDVAYAAYRFVPLTGLANADGRGDAAEQGRRLRLFCDAYGLAAEDRAALTAAVRDRLQALVDHIRTRAAAGDEAFAEHLAAGHADLYLADSAHVRCHEREWTALL
jgi:Ser/Thr protein kinase RdoA (MazF antagonist)